MSGAPRAAGRADLYYRLNVFGIVMPALRERPEDVPLLARHFLHRSCSVAGMAHAVIVETAAAIRRASLPAGLLSARGEAERQQSALGLRERLLLVEREILLDTLARANGIRKRAAEMLAIDPRNMAYFLQKHRLQDKVQT